jgi:outer membrane protein OmpA-like peptidoglycan-associated protein
MNKVFALLILFCSTIAYSDSLKIDKTSVIPGEAIQVTMANDAPLPQGAWIGVIPSDTPHGNESTNDQKDVDYQYTNQNKSFTFKAPQKPGAYDFRLSGGGKEFTSVSFEVKAVDYKAKLTLPKTALMPGEKVTLSFHVDYPLGPNAWIGIIPSDVPHGSGETNDQHDVNYQYVGDKTEGTMDFQVPDKAGSWDFRLNDRDPDGNEIGSVTFTVGEIKNEGTLKLSKTTFLPGEKIVLEFTASETLPPSAWVGMVPSKVKHGSEETNDQNDIQWNYVDKKTSGTMNFLAPPDAGSYDLRLNSSDSNGVEIASVTFQVGGKLDATAMGKIIQEQGKLALYGIQFDFNQATIKPESEQVLTQVVEVLKAQPDLKLLIEGNTDNVGKPAYNLELSKKRAESVKLYLVEKGGIDGSRLTTQGYGDTKPVAKNDTEAGRAQNRRVELVRQ